MPETLIVITSSFSLIRNNHMLVQRQNGNLIEIICDAFQTYLDIWLFLLTSPEGKVQMFPTLSLLLRALVSAIDGLLIMRQSSSPALTWLPDYPLRQIEGCKCAHPPFPDELSCEIDDTKSHGDDSFGKYWTGMYRGEHVFYFCRGWPLECFGWRLLSHNLYSCHLI